MFTNMCLFTIGVAHISFSTCRFLVTQSVSFLCYYVTSTSAVRYSFIQSYWTLIGYLIVVGVAYQQCYKTTERTTTAKNKNYIMYNRLSTKALVSRILFIKAEQNLLPWPYYDVLPHFFGLIIINYRENYSILFLSVYAKNRFMFPCGNGVTVSCHSWYLVT